MAIRRYPRHAWAALALCTSLMAVRDLHAMGAAARSSANVLLSPTFAPPLPADLTPAQVDALITKLGDDAFAVRQDAQTALEAAAAASANNAYLIIARLKAI